MTLKNQIVRLHRWFGFIMCLFFVAWFLSGFVMMYVDFPQYSKKARLAHQPVLSLDSCQSSPSSWSPVLPQDTSWKKIRLNMLLGRPVLRYENREGTPFIFYADKGIAVPRISFGQANAIAKEYAFSYSATSTEQIYELDQWIPRKAFMIHMPIYRMHMNDPAQTVIYISSRTGEILQVHTRTQRVLAWCGPIIHWIYPKELILRRPLWRVVVIVFSSLGIVASITGIVAGFHRLKKKKSGGYASPYRKKWFRWHHYTGFIFGLFTFTWVFSGLLTMSPFDWSPEVSINDQENLRLQGGSMLSKSFTVSPFKAFDNLQNHFSIVEIELIRFQGRSYYIASNASGKTCIAVADAEGLLPFRYFQTALVLKAIASVHPHITPSEVSVLEAEDDYYYSKHNDRPLPVLRVKYADHTWYYVDPFKGEIVLKNNASSRISRWLYHGLHSLDFFKFQHWRPIWDMVIMILLSGGTLVSLTGMALTLRFFFRNKK